MKFMGLYKRNKTAVRFLITYILLLVIPIIIASTNSISTQNAIINTTVENSEKVLEQNSEAVASYLRHAEKTVSSIRLDNYLFMLNNSSSMENNRVYYNIVKLIENLNSYILTDDFYVDMFIILDRYKYIITSNTVYNANNFYNVFFSYNGLDYNQWIDLVMKNSYNEFLPAALIKYGGAERLIIPYVCSLSPASRSTGNDAIVLMLNEDKVTSLLNGIDIGDKGYVYVATGTGTIITYVAGKNADAVMPAGISEDIYQNINGMEMIVTSVVSSNNGWHYVSVIPKDYILREVSMQYRRTILLLGLAMLIGIACALMFTAINMRPLKEVVHSIMAAFTPGGSVAPQTEYEMIETHFRKIISENTDLQNKLDVLLPVMHNAVFESLLNGTYFQNDEIYNALKYINLDLDNQIYTVAVVKITYSPDDFQEFARAKILVAEIVMSGSVYLHYGEKDKIIMLCSSESESDFKHELESFAQNAVKQIKDKYDIDVVFGLGSIYSDATNISKSYKEAIQVIDYLYLGRKVIWYDELPQTSGIYYYPPRIEMSLLSAVKNGNYDEVESIMRKLYYENFANRKLTPRMGRQLLNELYGTAFSAMEGNAEHLADTITPCETKNIEDEFEDIISLFESICSELKENRMRYKTELIERIIAYLETEYTNERLSLSSVAEYFSLSETYLSHLFKDETGDNFSKYVESKRIKLACSMIGKMQVKDIAVEIGYSNVLTFSRAFSRVMGCSPSKYARSQA